MDLRARRHLRLRGRYDGLSFLSFYLLELGATQENVELWTSLASSSTFLMGAIVLPIWGALSDRMGQKKMILRASASLALAFSWPPP